MKRGADTDGGRVPPTEDLYDRYLEACLAGKVEDPDAFCDRFGKTESDLHTRLQELHTLFREREAKTARPSAGPEAEAGMPFERLGDFRLLRRLDAGGMGMIYLAEQESLGRTVALKIIRPELQDSATASERFRREAFAVARLQHPNIVQIHALGADHGVRFLAMEFIEGTTLDDVLRDSAVSGEGLSTARVTRWMRDLARALHYAHENGVVHRDIKPGNIRITPDDQPMILDFGVARDERWSGQTLTQGFTGSPLYAAPEQLNKDAGETDGRADIYAVGVTLYQCLTGTLPFRDETMERIFHRVLTEDPVPPRRVNPAVPRDLDVVTRKAMEKSPEKRYQTAHAFADDLEAVLEFQPIQAKPPGTVSRVYKWSRRRPGPAAALGTTVLAILGLAIFLVVQGVAERNRQLAQAADLVTEARDRVELYRQRREATAGLEKEVGTLLKTMHAQYTTDEQDRLMTEKEDAVMAFQREREAVFHEVLELLRRAHELDADVKGTDGVRAALFAEKWHEAKIAYDEPAAEYYRERVNELDPEGRLGARMGRYPLFIASEPAGAEVYLFRIRDQSAVVEGGEHRWVPVPTGGATTPVPPGTFCLKVVRAAGSVELDDLLLDVAGHPIRDAVFVVKGNDTVRPLDRLLSADGKPVKSLYDIEKFGAGGPAPEGQTREFEFDRGGTRISVRARSLEAAGIRCGMAAEAAALPGTPVTLFRMGETRSIKTPAGLVLRATAIPVFLSPECRIGRSPINRTITLDEGRYLFVFRLEGRTTTRMATLIHEESDGARVYIPAKGYAPPGFVHVAASGGQTRYGYLIMEREVIASEYLEFLNDPETLRQIEASQERIYFPRGSRGTRPNGFWRRTKEGFALGDDWEPDWPVLGVSWSDAKAYAEWKTKRAQRAGQRVEFDLPDFQAWMSASAPLRAQYHFGQRFRPKWIKSNYSRPQAMPEPVLRFPIDESPHGVYDMSGSASEWLDDWVDKARNVRRVAGGSWGNANPQRFLVWGAGQDPATTAGTIGFRLVMRRLEDSD